MGAKSFAHWAAPEEEEEPKRKEEEGRGKVSCDDTFCEILPLNLEKVKERKKCVRAVRAPLVYALRSSTESVISLDTHFRWEIVFVITSTFSHVQISH